MKIKLLAIAGPTASGKTDLAIRLCKRLQGEVISADSMQLYKGLNIGTAKPSYEQQQGIPHHLLDILPPDAAFTAADYQQAALQKIQEITDNGKLPVLAGGTGLYFQAVLYSLTFSNTPPKASLRSEWEQFLQQHGAQALHAKLMEKNPQAAAKLHPNDTKRLLRAMEVDTAKTDTESAQNAQWYQPRPALDFLLLVLKPERQNLYRRIDERTRAMFSQGLWEETEALLSREIPLAAQSMQAIGYRETAQAILNGTPREETLQLVARNTRRYAKRQLTWFLRDPNAVIINTNDKTSDQLEQSAWEEIQKKWPKAFI